MARMPKGGPSMPSMRYQKGLPQVHVGAGKGNQIEMLPSRHALATITGGDPAHRSLGWYAKLTPSGSGAPGKYADIMALGLKGPKI